MNRVLMVLGAIIPALVCVLAEIIRGAMEARDIRKQVEDFYNESEYFNNACSKLSEVSNSCSCSIQEFCEAISKASGGNGELYEIYDDAMQATPINADAHLPSCKCSYCGCTNDHIYGTCDYCGAPLEG